MVPIFLNLSYLIHHHSHKDILIDNPGVKLTMDWIFGLKGEITLWCDRTSSFLHNKKLEGKGNVMKVDVSVYCYCRLLCRPEKLKRNINWLFLGCQ